MGSFVQTIGALTLVLAVAQSHGTMTFEEYWQSKLPNTPMPTFVREHLNSGSSLKVRESTKDGATVPVEGGDALITFPYGNPVAINDVRRPVALVYDNEKMSDDAVISGLDGNALTIHDQMNKDHIKLLRDGDDALITGPDGNPVTIHDVRRPRPFLYDNDKEDKTEVPVVTEQDAHVEEKSGVHSHQMNGRIDNPNARFYFLERDMHVGAKVEEMFRRPMEGDHFLPRSVAASMPFSSSELPEIFKLFSIDRASPVAKMMREVHRYCELPALPEEVKCCATSFESLVDFVATCLDDTSNMAIKMLFTTAEKAKESTPQMHTMTSISRVHMVGSTAAVCHLESYPYTVYHCHKNPAIRPYLVKLVDESDGSKVRAAVSCHTNTGDWKASHYALRALKVKPGEAVVCHFVPIGDMIFLPTATSSSGTAMRDRSDALY